MKRVCISLVKSGQNSVWDSRSCSEVNIAEKQDSEKKLEMYIVTSIWSPAICDSFLFSSKHVWLGFSPCVISIRFHTLLATLASLKETCELYLIVWNLILYCRQELGGCRAVCVSWSVSQGEARDCGSACLFWVVCAYWLLHGSLLSAVVSGHGIGI